LRPLVAGQVALLGESGGAATSLLFAAAHPERVSHLVLNGSLVRALRSDKCPWGVVETRAEYESVLELIIEGWGGSSAARMWSRAAHEEELELIARYQRMAISPKGFRDRVLATLDIDIRPVLSAVKVPTLVLHKVADPVVDIGQGRYLADRIPLARLVELDV
jgi:pimeloyl-ACP methyl ester carboxylesterase